MQLVGKAAIVTGGANGIGAAIARRFVTEGARVVIADIEDEAGQQLASDLQELGSAIFVHTDVGERLDVHNLVAAARDAHGEIDVLVNSAGILAEASFLDLAIEDFDAVMRVNLKGSFMCGQAVARTMVERVKDDGPAGTIINLSSINAKLALPNQVPYTISKGAVRQLTNVMAQSLAPYGIRVNAIGPGSIATEMLMKAVGDPDNNEDIMARTPLGRAGQPDEVAAIATFLASDEASYITGQTIYADGGRLGLAYTVHKPDDAPSS
ncbi:MAG: glucose 1-dehydrogenase [Pseudomonadota bacterium]